MQRYGVLLVSALLVAASGLAGGRAAAEPDPERRQASVDRARTKLVVVKAAGSDRRGVATGFLVEQGLVLTSAHGVRGAGGLVGWLNGVAYPARLLASHRDYDLALLRLNAPELFLRPLPLARDTTGLQGGAPLVVLTAAAASRGGTGDPRARVVVPAVFEAREQLLAPEEHGGERLSLLATVEPGDSGSPVLDPESGLVLGLVTSRDVPDATGVSRACQAVPAEQIRAWLGALPPTAPAGDEFYLFRAPARRG